MKIIDILQKADLNEKIVKKKMKTTYKNESKSYKV